MLLRWGKEMEDNHVNALDFQNASPTALLGCTITGAELGMDGDGGFDNLCMYATAADGTKKVLSIFVDGPSEFCSLQLTHAIVEGDEE